MPSALFQQRRDATQRTPLHPHQASVLAAVVNLFVLVQPQRPWLAQRRSDVTAGAMRSVVGVGLAFMVLQIAYAVGFSSDRIVAAQVVGRAAVR